MVSITIAKVLLKLGNKVEIFSIGDSNKEYFIERNIKCNIIKGAKYYEEGINLHRVFDFFYLYFFNYRISIKLINNNKKFVNTVKGFKPDILIVTSMQIIDLAKKISELVNNIKIIACSDSPIDLLNNVFKAIKKYNIPKFFVEKLKKKYMTYHLNLFKKMFNLANMIIVFTYEDKKKVSEDFNIKSEKINVIPFLEISKIPNPPKKFIKDIKKILFIGVCGYYANDEAISIITEKIAPKLIDKHFIIIGKNCKSKKIENVEIIGSVSQKQLQKILAGVDLCLAPLLNGGGIKTKVLSYILAYKPVIGTSLAFRGYPIKNKVNVIIEDNINNYPEIIRKLESNKKLLLNLQTNTNSILEYFSMKETAKKWSKLLKSL